MADLMESLIQTFNPAHLQPLPLAALYMRACHNLLNIYRYTRRSPLCSPLHP